MIISIRGPCGSGKSTLVSRVIESAVSVLVNQRAGRRVPWSIVLTRERGPLVWVAGHYDVRCGGLDTVRPRHLDAIYADASEAARLGLHVLMEGAATYDRWERLKDLSQHGETRVLWLETPAIECLEGLRNKKPNLSPRRQVELMRTGKIVKDVERLRAAGIPAFAASRDGAVDILEEWLS